MQCGFAFLECGAVRSKNIWITCLYQYQCFFFKYLFYHFFLTWQSCSVGLPSWNVVPYEVKTPQTSSLKTYTARWMFLCYVFFPLNIDLKHNYLFFLTVMQCGFAFLECGAVRSKNATNILIKNILDSCKFSKYRKVSNRAAPSYILRW